MEMVKKDKLIGLKLTTEEYDKILKLSEKWHCSKQKAIRKVLFKGSDYILKLLKAKERNLIIPNNLMDKVLKGEE